jgi:APA family basic amino acid/polyamine antiporter
MSLNNVIGSGVYLLPAAAAALLGSASLWAVALAGLVVLLLVLCFAEAGSRFDEPGGAYVYTREAFGPFVGFQVGWMTWLTRVASAAALWNGFAQALTFFWPGATAGAARVAVITVPLALNVWINIVGVKHGARLGVGLTIAKILPLLFLIAVGIPALNGSLIFPMHAPSAAGLGEAATLLIFAYGGFENTAAAAGEFKDPKRDVPFALITVIATVTVLYTLIQVVAVGTLPNLAALTQRSPLAESAAMVIGVWGGIILTLGAAISTGGNSASNTLIGPRYLYALAKDGFGPRVLCRANARYQTPAWAIVTQESIVLTAALSGSFVQLALLSVVARLFTYMGTAAAVPVLRRKLKAAEHTVVLPGGATIPVLALLVSFACLASLSVDKLIAGLVALAIGVAIYLFRRKPSSQTAPPGI